MQQSGSNQVPCKRCTYKYLSKQKHVKGKNNGTSRSASAQKRTADEENVPPSRGLCTCHGQPMPVPADNVKNILVLYTGGTIGMKKNPQGALAPEANVFLNKIRRDSELNCSKDGNDRFEVPRYGYENDPGIIYEIREYDPLLDSSNMSTGNWIKIARDVGNEYENYNGFVILHGTDTLAYTASALSFMLRNLQKPVILTGAQISIFVSGSDAKNNFLSALKFAAYSEVKEVCVCFANKLLRGNRTVKHSSESIEAFSTPNYNVLAEVTSTVEVDNRFTLPLSTNQPDFVYNLNENVVILRIFPTMSEKMLSYILKPPTEGVVLLSYGAGNIPNREDLKADLREAVKKGVIIVNLTQCLRGGVRAVYEGGEMLKEVGVLPGNDMTVEAAFSKLTYVLGQQHLSLEEKKRMMTKNLCGEFTESN
ncbi:hypothetical protein Trydic_g22195 [Trypoxylus dichotomus]